MYNEVIKLISTTETTDTAGDTTETPIEKEVFAELRSIGQTEFYQAQALGLKPEIKFVLADYYDYDGEQELKYNDTPYRVLRTYRAGNEIELICTGDVHVST